MRFLTFFNFFSNVFYLKKTLNSQYENNDNLKHLSTKKLKNLSVLHKITADFVFRFTYFYF